jgi:apolipoprotein N-acyltransferase
VTLNPEFNAPAAILSRRARLFCAAVTALLLWIPAQKWGLFPLAWFGLAPFLWACGDLPSRARFCYGWAAGFLFYALTNWWIAPTVVYGSPMIGAPKPLAVFLGIFAVSLIAAVHGSQFAVAAWLWDEKRWRSQLWLLPLIVAAWWMFFDYARCIPPLAHIWGALAFTQWRDTALLQILPFFGQHGLTALLVWCGASLALWYRTRTLAFLSPVGALAVVHLLGSSAGSFFPDSSAGINTWLVSTNVPSLRKSGLTGGETPFAQAERLSFAQATPPGDIEPSVVPFPLVTNLVVWPETTLEFEDVEGRFIQTGERLGQLTRIKSMLSARGYKVALLTGAQQRQIGGESEKLFNTALLLTNRGQAQSAPKIRTVPMGEKAPFGDWIPFLRRFAPNPEITPGTEPKTLDLNGTPIGTVICFESCFPDPARAVVKKGAKVLFVLTNDEWFKGTNAPWEHAAMAVIRAAENRVPVAQVANGGYTLLVDSRGRILHQSFGAGATPVTIPLN